MQAIIITIYKMPVIKGFRVVVYLSGESVGQRRDWLESKFSGKRVKDLMDVKHVFTGW